MNRSVHGGRIAALVPVLILGLHLMLATSPAAASDTPGDKIVLAALFGSDSKPAPDFTLPDVNGANVQLGGYKGKQPVLLYFWATWCPKCLEVRPAVINLRKELSTSDLEILAINVGGADSVDRLKRFVEKNPSPLRTLFDGEGAVIRAYAVHGIPTFVLVDKNGAMVYRGYELPKDLKGLIKR